MFYPKFFIILILIIAGCTQTNTVQEQTELFSISAFINREIDSLLIYNPMIVKEISLNKNETVDTILTTNYSKSDWQNELTIFSSLDVNKPALIDNYILLDSSDRNYNIQVIRALKQNLKTRSTWVYRNKTTERIDKIEIEFLDDNMIYQSAKHLVYYPGKGYSIHTTQDVLMNKPDNIIIEAKYVYKP
jgi:hypothetical protein